MDVIKKSFNLSTDLAKKIDDFILANPGTSFTWLVNQAILNWLNNPQVALRRPSELPDEDLDQFIIEDNSEPRRYLTK